MPAAIGLAAGGSASEVVGEYLRDLLSGFRAGLKHDGWRRTRFHYGSTVSISAWQHRATRAIPVKRMAGRLSHGQGDLGEADNANRRRRSEEHTSELQSLMRSSYAVFCLKKKRENLNATTST